MRGHRNKPCTAVKPGILYLVLPVALALSGLAAAQQIEQKDQIWVTSVIRETGQPVIPVFDGWFPNFDGTRSLCFGYFNMNTAQTLEIPHGDQNYLSDARFREMSPTHFEPTPLAYRRKFCVFTVEVPVDFRQDETIVWHLTSAGQALSVPGHVLPAYVLDEPNSLGRGRMAPAISTPGEDTLARGRRGEHFSKTWNGSVDMPLAIDYTITHDRGEVWVGWSKFSGPGTVQFAQDEHEVPSDGSVQTQSVVFGAPGDYILQLQSIESTADFEFFCCHSNAYFQVSVR